MKTQTITDEMAEESLEPQKNLSQDWLGYQCGFCGRYLFNKKNIFYHGKNSTDQNQTN